MTTVVVEVYAGGASGGNGNGNGNHAGGGGGGAYSKLNAFTISSGTGYTATVAAALNDAGDGNDSWFSTSGTVLAKGGKGGDSSFSGGAGGAGGASASGIGDTKYSGGAGGNNTGGGGGAGSTGAGSIGTGTGGAGGGGLAGSGGDAGRNDGNPAGGGGGGEQTGANNGGGFGARGAVKITAPLGTVTATGGTHTSDATNDYWTFTASGTWTPTIVPPATGNFLLFL